LHYSFGYGHYSFEKYDWIAFTKPIDVSKPGKYDLEFVSQMNANYELVFETERNIEFREQNCRLGIETFKFNECDSYPEKLIIKWSVHQGENLISEGSSNKTKSAIWGVSIGKILAYFQTEEGIKYHVKADVISPDTELIKTNPSLKIKVSGSVYKDAFVISSLIVYLSYILTGIAIAIWFLFLLFRRWKLKHKT
jgi:hypothetical protein